MRLSLFENEQYVILEKMCQSWRSPKIWTFMSHITSPSFRIHFAVCMATELMHHDRVEVFFSHVRWFVPQKVRLWAISASTKARFNFYYFIFQWRLCHSGELKKQINTSDVLMQQGRGGGAGWHSSCLHSDKFIFLVNM